MTDWMGRVLEMLSLLSPTNTVLLVVNVLLLIFARSIVLRFAPDTSNDKSFQRRVHFFRAANVLVILFILFFNVIMSIKDHSLITRILTTIVIGYICYLSFHTLNYLLKRRFGRVREVNGETIFADTYNSRILALISGILIFVIGLIATIRIMGFESLLEAGGVIGFIGVLLALTQGAWAPDIISGLIILNSKLVQEGDVIEFSDNGEILGIVFKTRVFYTEILNLVNNHRIMVQNARLRAFTLHNLSRFASARGLRENLAFKIGYEASEERVTKMFENAFEQAQQANAIAIEFQYPLEVRAVEAGDYAVEWHVFYYIKDIRQLLRTRQQFLALILQQARECDISLATPVRLQHEPGGAVTAGPEAV